MIFISDISSLKYLFVIIIQNVHAGTIDLKNLQLKIELKAIFSQINIDC